MYPSDQVKIILINSDNMDLLSDIQKIRDKYFNKETLFVRDEESALADRFKVARIPYTVIYSRGYASLIESQKLNFDDKRIHLLIKNALQ